MAPRKRLKRSEEQEVVDYVAIVECTTLNYRISHYRQKGMSFRPYSRSLYLYSEMVQPKQIAGARMNALLMADPALQEMFQMELGATVGTISKHGDELQFFAEVPIEFVPSFSAAFHDKRLQILYGRGSPLRRGTSLLTCIGFHERTEFESGWGEPLRGSTTP